MAEVVMRGIALGPPLLELAIKLKFFIDDWKDAPDDITQMLEEINLAASMIYKEGEIYSQVKVPNDLMLDGAWKDCLRVCKTTLDSLKLAVSETQS